MNVYCTPLRIFRVHFNSCRVLCISTEYLRHFILFLLGVFSKAKVKSHIKEAMFLYIYIRFAWFCVFSFYIPIVCINIHSYILFIQLFCKRTTTKHEEIVNAFLVYYVCFGSFGERWMKGALQWGITSTELWLIHCLIRYLIKPPN